MAVKFFRKLRKNADGTYDILHPETQAKVVWMSDGRSVEEAVADHTHTASEIVVLDATDYTANRVRGIALSQDEAVSVPNGCLCGVYTIS